MTANKFFKRFGIALEDIFTDKFVVSYQDCFPARERGISGAAVAYDYKPLGRVGSDLEKLIIKE